MKCASDYVRYGNLSYIEASPAIWDQTVLLAR